MFTVLIVLATFTQGQGQEFSQTQAQTLEECLNEGRLLYRLWWTKERGQNAFFEPFGFDVAIQTWRQLSYQNKQGHYVSILFEEKKEYLDDRGSLQIQARAYFDDLSSHKPILLDTLNNIPTPKEVSLIKMKADINRRLTYDENYMMFKHYDNASHNWIPVISNGRRSIFVFSSPSGFGLIKSVMFGEDYRLTYDDNNELVKWDKLHDTLIELPELSGEVVDQIKSLMYELSPSWLITPVDIFTLLKYGDSAEFKRENAMGNKMFYPEYDREREEIIIMTIRELMTQRVQD